MKWMSRKHGIDWKQIQEETDGKTEGSKHGFVNI
jgi:hypothetical protein